MDRRGDSGEHRGAQRGHSVRQRPFRGDHKDRATGSNGFAAQPAGALWLPEEAAAFLRVPRSLVMELVRKELLPAVRVGRFVRFRQEDLDAWAAKGGAHSALGGVR
jgi:excisionase family DNA binding protein